MRIFISCVKLVIYWHYFTFSHKCLIKSICTCRLIFMFCFSRKRGKKGEKGGKGLRHFSMKVCEKVQRKGVTSYNEVADELVAEFSDPRNLTSPSDQVWINWILCKFYIWCKLKTLLLKIYLWWIINCYFIKLIKWKTSDVCVYICYKTNCLKLYEVWSNEIIYLSINWKLLELIFWHQSSEMIFHPLESYKLPPLKLHTCRISFISRM